MAVRRESRVLSWPVVMVVCVLALATGLAAGCGSGGGSGGGDGGRSGGSASPPSSSASTGSHAGDDVVDAGSGGSAPARAEIERRLSVRRFAYVAETDISQAKRVGALAVIDSKKDTLAHRPEMGKEPDEVAVAPDGRLVYVTDVMRPVVHVLDAETFNEVRTIRLPGVKPGRQRFTATGAMGYAEMQGCSSSIACTPGGEFVLVLTKAGLQAIDTATHEVVRTVPELKDGFDIAVSFDGERAYIATLDYLQRGAKTLSEWSQLSVSGAGGGLALLDLRSWEVVRRVKCGLIGDIAVDPDDTRFFASDNRLQSLRIVDPETLKDLSVIDLKSARARDFQPRGVGVLPDGSKIYVVCADTSMKAVAARGAGADEFFCAVIDAASEEVVKRIPLDAY